MELERYKKRLGEIETETTRLKIALAKEYALANNTVKVGDIVTDHIGSLLVRRIKFGWGIGINHIPYCIYQGLSLKKNLEPRKDGETRGVHQTNLK